jgi:N-acetylglucosamine-6-phosphate deacetylase
MEIYGIHYITGNPVRISVADGIIAKIVETSGESVTPGVYVAPGLIDNQVNGYHGVDFSSNLLEHGILKIAAEAVWKDGVTTFVPTVVTGSYKDMLRSLRILSEDSGDPYLRGSIPGFHLEGPYLSREEGFYGCHPAEHLRDPSLKEFTDFREAAGGKIIEITLAPELTGAMELIKKCSRAGILTGLGHTNASADQINKAVRSGARISTHLGNGCANTIHRHHNPIWPQLANDMLAASIIADGHHLLPEEIKVFCRAKRYERIILTSDVTYLIGMPPGDYNYMGSRVLKTDDGLIKNVKLDCLAGASMPLKKGLETVMSATGCGLDEAIDMASRNVARILELNDRGKIEEGMRADLILFSLEKNAITIEKTILKGETVFTR